MEEAKDGRCNMKLVVRSGELDKTWFRETLLEYIIHPNHHLKNSSKKWNTSDEKSRVRSSFTSKSIEHNNSKENIYIYKIKGEYS